MEEASVTGIENKELPVAKLRDTKSLGQQQGSDNTDNNSNRLREEGNG